MAAGAGWYPEPGREGALRWWDGQSWTDPVSDVPAEVESHGPGSLPVGGEGVDGGLQAPEQVNPDAGGHRGRKPKWVLVPAAVLVVLGAVAAVIVGGRVFGDDRPARYQALLEERDVADEFANEAAALASGKRTCTELDGGSAPQGYARDAVAVEVFCGEYLDAFVVVPTPEEQRDDYLGALTDASLRGEFRSDEQAVAAAQQVCRDLEAGGPQQGLPVAEVAVSVYCPAFLDGFNVLVTGRIQGEFTLSYFSLYGTGISTTGSNCAGDGGFSDIREGTTVRVTNEQGVLVGQSALEAGTGTALRCTFRFSVMLTEGEDSTSSRSATEERSASRSSSSWPGASS